jgi:aryl-alcohol dehydrogenase-like predicted oxidoreductase
MASIDASLRRLDLDYVDLYQMHRWDPDTPVIETMEAFNDLVQAGKVRYIGASTMATWQFATAQHTAELHNWSRFVSMQGQYSLVDRDVEREMLPYCRYAGVGVLPYSPLSRGLLARPRGDALGARTVRAETDDIAHRMYDDQALPIVDGLAAVAAERELPMAQVALAWLLGRDAVVAPVVGATNTHHIDDAVAAVSVKLTDGEVRRLKAADRRTAEEDRHP